MFFKKMLVFQKINSSKEILRAIIRGSERIRTAVDGFADHCLAARPRNHFLNGAKVVKVFYLIKILINIFHHTIKLADYQLY